MDDLSGLSWTTNSNDANKPPPVSSGSLFTTMRPTPLSGRSTPLSGLSGSSNPPSKPVTPANDSFANLVSFGSSNSNKNLSLLEQQKRLQEERAKQEAQKRAQLEAQYGGNNAQFWDSLGQGGSKHGHLGTASNLPKAQTPIDEDEDDILAAFNASAPVDASTHFPVPSSSPSPPPAPNNGTSNGKPPAPQRDPLSLLDDDDDPFGLRQMNTKPAPGPQLAQTQNDTDDDFLGDLAKPVSEFSRPAAAETTKTSSPVREDSSPSPKPSDALDRALAELVDMGFSADKARQALESTESGTDVQAAISWLLNQAHAESRQKAKARADETTHFPDRRERSGEANGRRERGLPAWMRDEGRSHIDRSGKDSRAPSSGERDPAQIAANFGNNLLKTANSLWKTGSKKLQQALEEFNSEHDPSRPRWMRDAAFARDDQRSHHQLEESRQDSSNLGRLTDEALLLESDASRPSRNPTRSREEPRRLPESDQPNAAPHTEKRVSQPAFLQQRTQQQQRLQANDPKSRLTRSAVEEESAQAYVSPARRRRPTPQPQESEPNTGLLESSAPSPPSRPSAAAPPSQPSQPPKLSTPLPARPKAPPRTIPQVSPSSLAASHQHRAKGTEAYKRGDYAAAHEAFSAALSMLPDKHPITIILLSNRAMTALKIGEPKSAIADADAVLEVIGPSRGEGEMIDLGNGEPHKPMKEFFGKALMRKAEALEQLERWEDAANVWKLAVETGHGGSTSIQGRNRCEKAAGISKPAPKPSTTAAQRPAQPKTAPKKSSALDDLAGRPAPMHAASAEAVSRLRKANEAADRIEEEKLALRDKVDARIAAWKGGKQDNLRALLGSLDTVLWPEAGWKKVNMSELVLPNKVKVQYMKGIAKVHPDKVCLILHPSGFHEI